MKNSERIILMSLFNTSESITKIKLVKLLFLFSMEGFDSTFSFLPYKYGPFSFQLYRNISALSHAGWMDEELLKIHDDKKEDALNEIRMLPKMTRDNLVNTYQRYGRLSEKEILKIVYAKYPEFTFRSKMLLEKAPQPVAPISIYTIGYEGISIDAFLNTLLQKGLSRLIDVRRNPISRKWGFAKSTLSGLCDKVGIDYLHFPELGISLAQRMNITTKEDYDKLFYSYEKNYLPLHKHTVKNVLSLMEQTPSALVCMEADVQMCHRGRLASMLNKMSDIQVVHLSAK
ncbi:MAG: DUF488 family protein [Thermodesulfovibrionia bacterium]|nr:DUF488 family protein [Thermodesulfovibrionia bacterium]